MSKIIVEKLSPAIAALEQFVAGAPNGMLEKTAKPMLQQLQTSISDWQPRAALFFYGRPTGSSKNVFDDYFEDTLQLSEFLKKTELRFTAQITGKPVQIDVFDADRLAHCIEPNAAIIFILDDQKDGATVAGHFAAFSANTATAYIYAPKKWITENRSLPKFAEMAAACQFFDIQTLAEKKIKTDIEALFDQKIRTAIGGYSASAALDSITLHLLEKIQVQDAHFKNAKILNQQRMAIHNKNGGSSFGAMSHGELKNAIARRQERFQQQFKDRLEQLFNPHQGEFAAIIDREIDQLTTLEEQNQATKMLFVVPESFSDHLIAGFKKHCALHFKEDLEQARQTATVIENEIENYLSDRGLTHPVLAWSMPDERRAMALLDAQVRIERKHEGNLQHKKLMQYFMEARKYFMLVAMILATFGLGWLRKMTTFFIPLSILLIGFGAFQAWTGRKKEAEEAKENNLKTAKDALKNEFRRTLQEIRRNWETLLMGSLDGAANSMRDEAERLLAASDTKTKNITDAEKRQIDSVEREFRLEESWLPRALDGSWRRDILVLKKNFASELTKHFNG